MEWIKIYLKIYICLYFVVLFIIPGIRLYKQTGINPVTFGNRDNVHDYLGFVMKLLMMSLTVIILFSGFTQEQNRYLVPVWFLEKPWAVYTGLILIHVSFFWILVAEIQMNRSFRIGIDEKNKTALVTNGVFRISRNPVFLGIMISVWGIFFILPNLFTFTIAVLTYFTVHVQIRLEESFLEKQHGGRYLQYKKRVRRII